MSKDAKLRFFSTSSRLSANRPHKSGKTSLASLVSLVFTTAVLIGALGTGCGTGQSDDPSAQNNSSQGSSPTSSQKEETRREELHPPQNAQPGKGKTAPNSRGNADHQSQLLSALLQANASVVFTVIPAPSVQTSNPSAQPNASLGFIEIEHSGASYDASSSNDFSQNLCRLRVGAFEVTHCCRKMLHSYWSALEPAKLPPFNETPTGCLAQHFAGMQADLSASSLTQQLFSHTQFHFEHPEQDTLTYTPLLKTPGRGWSNHPSLVWFFSLVPGSNHSPLQTPSSGSDFERNDNFGSWRLERIADSLSHPPQQPAL